MQNVVINTWAWIVLPVCSAANGKEEGEGSGGGDEGAGSGGRGGREEGEESGGREEKEW